VNRPYAGFGDLSLLIRFAGKALSSRYPLDATWHPGDFIWKLKGAYDAEHALRLWTSAGKVTAVSWLVDDNALWMETIGQSENQVTAILASAEAEVLSQNHTADPQLTVRALEKDAGRVALLEQSGYRRGTPDAVIFRKGLAESVAGPILPEGMKLLDCTHVDADARSRCHRDAWNDLAHIGIPDARSTFTTEVYLSLRSAPGYDPALDLVVETPSGDLVSNCICWVDEQSRVGNFEPVGTSSLYRDRGIARAATLEGLGRLRERGMTFARVTTAHFNLPAIATYLSCGFEIIDRTYWWTKRLYPLP